MPYVSPTTVTAGAPGTSTWGNSVKAATDFLANPPACRVYNSAAQSIPNATATALAFNSERWDTNTMHDTATNNTRITINTAGLYVVTGSMEFAASATGLRGIAIRQNASATYLAWDRRMNVGGASGTMMAIGTVYKFTVGEYVELVVEQESGAALNSSPAANRSPEFSATWIGLG